MINTRSSRLEYSWKWPPQKVWGCRAEQLRLEIIGYCDRVSRWLFSFNRLYYYASRRLWLPSGRFLLSLCFYSSDDATVKSISQTVEK